jgi:hypothetical protein
MRLALAAVFLAAGAVAGVAAAQEEELPTRDCRGRIESGRGPLAFETSGALVVGPVAFSGLREPVRLSPWGDTGRLGRKSGLLVRAGRPRVGRVTGFSGGFSVTRAGCYPLDVAVVGGRRYRVRLSLGRPCR